MVESHIEDGKRTLAPSAACATSSSPAALASAKSCSTSPTTNFLVSYSILETPQPLTNHKATLQLRRVTDGDRTYAEWTASFDAAPEEADKLAEGMGANVFQGGFNALKSHFAGQN